MKLMVVTFRMLLRVPPPKAIYTIFFFQINARLTKFSVNMLQDRLRIITYL